MSGAERERGAPMLADELKRLFDRNLEANVQLLQRAGGVLKEAAQATRDPKRLSGTDARALLGDLVKLQLDYLKVLSASSTQYLEAVVSLAEQAVGPRGGAGGEGRHAVAVAEASATVLSGRLGESVAFRFNVDNPNPQPVDATVEAEDWRERGGGRVGAGSIVFDPVATVVPAEGAATVTGQVKLDERFVAGQTYDTVIRVAGFPGRQIAISLTVGAPAEG